MNGDAHLKAEFVRCRVLLGGDLKLDFAGGPDADRIQVFVPFIHRELRQNIENVLIYLKNLFHNRLVSYWIGSIRWTKLHLCYLKDK